MAKSSDVNAAVMDILRSLGITPSREEALGQAVTNLTDIDEEKLKLLSDVELGEINQLSLMLTIAERYDIDWLKTYVHNVLRLRVSANRLGRREIVRMIAGSAEREHAALRGWIARRFGRGKKKEETPYAPI
ncbi:hypothetical protein DRO69_07145 [Candidatus Bathyarchaeota archaeon]|nr:MAG: hypothetical protein DRO69_07145 [Candidatus Bathyarchaeota archaeon]